MQDRLVAEVMTGDVIQARPDTSVEELARLLDVHRISGLPVVDGDDKVMGVVSRTDLPSPPGGRTGGPAVAAGRPHPAPRRPAGDRAARGRTAGEVMTSPAVTVHPEHRVVDAARIMQRRHVDRLPVVDEEDRLIGITTRRDLLRVFLRPDEQIRVEVAEEVLGRTLDVPPGDVQVSVRDGLVTLRGTLTHEDDIPAAIGLTWRVDGVMGVVNRLVPRAGDGSAPLGGVLGRRWG
ncbi:CBS domain protein [Streptomyces griseoflavus]|uniref:CBS domain-containing protein n=1 Tax=Streptomyces rimosus TaxID=1927 RepID=UPI0004C63BF2|nr:CBS domain-containing protein [Streptomyces rimosus]KOG56293.1 CBS domain protein [Streptomyces griseoflavus]